MRLKKKIKIILLIIFLLGIGFISYAATSMFSESGVRSFNENSNIPLEFKTDIKRSKKVKFSLSVKDNKEKTGSVIVKCIDNNDNLKFEKEVLIGKSIEETFYFKRGGKEKIIITPKNFKGEISYSEKTICFY